jgi:hypothetical protein
VIPATILRRLTRGVILGPAPVRNAAVRRSGRREEAWLLSQPRPVRESFVREVLDRRHEPRVVQVWMLRQDDATRESYVREVLLAGEDEE